jgi:hypothetical protein
MRFIGVLYELYGFTKQNAKAKMAGKQGQKA